MLNSIIQVTGMVKFPITIDPTVWIFDERKLTEEEAFRQRASINELEEYTKVTSKHWDSEITEGAKIPPKQVYKKVALITETFFMPLAPFIHNAEPMEEATSLQVTTKVETHDILLTNLEDIYLLFSLKGKPLTSDGPVHLYFKSRGKDQVPIKNIISFKIC